MKYYHLLLCSLLFIGCEEDTVESTIDCGNPGYNYSLCQLVEQKSSLGSEIEFEYLGKRLKSVIINSNGVHSNTFNYEYDANNRLTKAYDLHTVSKAEKLSASYEFENNLIANYTIYHTDESVIQSTNYAYDGDCLATITVNYLLSGNTIEWLVTTDEKGNIMEMEHTVNDGSSSVVTKNVYEYDDALNPHYKSPNLIGQNEYFCPNNLTRYDHFISGELKASTVYENFDYNSANFPISAHILGSTVNYIYDCP